MNVWTRIASWLGGGRRAAYVDPLLAALNSRYPQYAGTVVSPDSATRKVAVGAAIRLITNTVRSMPAHAYQGEGADTARIADPVLLRDPDATGRGLPDWVAQMAWSLAARGNAVGHIVARTSEGLPATVIPIHPDQATPRVDTRTGEVSWRVGAGPGVAAKNIMHLRMFPVPGCVWGLSPIEQHAATIGLGIAAEKFGTDFFDAGGHPTALLKSAAPLGDEQAARVKAKFLASAASREPVLLPDGIGYEQIQIAPGESQFLDAQGYSSAECARIFGPGMAEMLGYETGGSMTYSNVVDRDIQLLKYTLDPYLVLIEDALSRALPQPQYVKLNRSSLLRTNTLDRYRAYQIAAQIGLQTPNEQRALEDDGPVPWGDVPYAVKTAAPAGQEPVPAQTGVPQ